MRRISLAALCVGVVLATTAGSCKDDFDSERGRGDAPIGEVTDEKVDVIQFPDRFSNIATTCDDHGHRLFMTTGGDFIAVIDDPSCTLEEER